MENSGHCGPNPEAIGESRGCCCFHLTTEHDFLRVYLHWLLMRPAQTASMTEWKFQQDGATCPTARATIDLLKDTFGDRLISRFGPVNWPPRSCDLTPLDYFLWGYVKSLVYADKPQTRDHLEDNIRRVIADVRPQMLEKVIEDWTSGLDYIRASSGSPMPEIIFKTWRSNFRGKSLTGSIPETFGRHLGHIICHHRDKSSNQSHTFYGSHNLVSQVIFLSSVIAHNSQDVRPLSFFTNLSASIHSKTETFCRVLQRETENCTECNMGPTPVEDNSPQPSMRTGYTQPAVHWTF
ncbi:uncharacterized protein TNCV_2126751 [Trichonephila clavipes]|nr:uncharacterized protein TNCV_2126751 [Trichonephila clavipes]